MNLQKTHHCFFVQNPRRTIVETYSICFQNDILLSESSHYTFVYDDNECSLVVLNARPEDSGVYTCTARNLAGSVSCKAELTIHEGKRLIYIIYEVRSTRNITI